MIKRRDIRDVEGCWRGVIVNSQWLPQWLGTGPFPWFINSSSQSDSVVEKSVPNLEAYTQHYMGLNHRPQDPCTRKYGPAFSDIPPPGAQIFLVSLHLSTHHSTWGTWSRNNSDQSTKRARNRRNAQSTERAPVLKGKYSQANTPYLPAVNASTPVVVKYCIDPKCRFLEKKEWFFFSSAPAMNAGVEIKYCDLVTRRRQ